jgi:hypothetical protein
LIDSTDVRCGPQKLAKIQGCLATTKQGALIIAHGTSSSLAGFSVQTLANPLPNANVIWLHGCYSANEVSPALAASWNKQVVGMIDKISIPKKLREVNVYVSKLEEAFSCALTIPNTNRTRFFDALASMSDQLISEGEPTFLAGHFAVAALKVRVS